LGDKLASFGLTLEIKQIHDTYRSDSLQVDDFKHRSEMRFLRVESIEQENCFLGPLKLSKVGQIHERTFAKGTD